LQLTRLLDASGATLARQRKHHVWKLPSGQNLVIAATPSDWRQSRKALADLRRLLVTVPGPAAPLPTEPATRPAPASRTRVPNWPARPRTGVVELPRPDTSAPLAESVEELPSVPLLDLIGKQPAFWRLGPGGRIRFLAKLLLQPGRRVEIVGEIFCRARRDEIERLAASPSDMGVRMAETTHYTYYPALLIHRSGSPHLFVDVYASKVLGAKNELIPVAIRAADTDFSVGNGLTLATTLPDEPHDGVMFGIFPLADLKRWGTFIVDEGWTNPAVARGALREILARARALQETNHGN
jgi:hypothetical protein